MRKITAIVSAMALCALFGLAAAAEPDTATATIQNFYIKYLDFWSEKPSKTARPTLVMSKSFSAEIKKNADICAKYVSGPCGWGADGDEYLDAQEIDPKLTYQNSGIAIKEIQPNTVQVQLNIYPSEKDQNGADDRTITYRMVKENGAWVVDDVAYTDGVSSRKMMADENADAIAHPDPDAAGAPQPQKPKK